MISGDAARSAWPGDASDAPSSREAWLFAQALRGVDISNMPGQRDAAAEEEYWQWLADVSTRPVRKAGANQEAYDGARPMSEAWLFAQELLGNAMPGAAAQQELLEFVRDITATEGGWDPAKHPRGEFPQNRGWFSHTCGPQDIFATQAAVDAVEAARLTGYEFRLAWTSDPSLPNRSTR